MIRQGSLTRRGPAMLVALACLLVPDAGSGEVFRSVDEAGRVTFSDIPPSDAVEVVPVEIEQGPTAEEVRVARERLAAERERLDAMAAAREAEQERQREARLQRLEEQALRRAADAGLPDLGPYDEPDSVPYFGFGHRGFPLLYDYPEFDGFPHHHDPHHEGGARHPRFRHPEPLPPRKVLDSPLFDKRVSPVYR